MVNTCKLIYIAIFICFKFIYFVFVSYVDLTRLTESKGFPGGSAGKESPGNMGDLVSIAGLGRFPGERKGYQPQHSGLENSMDYIVHGVTKGDLRQDWATPTFHKSNEEPVKGNRIHSLGTDPQLQVVIFLFLFFSYTLSLMGNVIIILLTLLDIRLKTPMHFFLCCFSFLEIIFTTVCIPKYVVIMVTKKKTIAYNCAAQLFFLFCELQTITFWLSCPMTAMLPSANRYITLSSWTAKFVISLYSDLE